MEARCKGEGARGATKQISCVFVLWPLGCKGKWVGARVHEGGVRVGQSERMHTIVKTSVPRGVSCIIQQRII